MSWFRDGYEKASYCISTTGRQPAMQSPTAPPSNPASASGVSTQRSGPKRSRNPAVARNTPPARPTSSPSTITSSSRASSVCSASLTASTSVSSAIAHVLRRVDVGVREDELGVGGRLGLCRCDPGAHQLLRFLPRRFGALLGEDAGFEQQPLEAADTLVRAFLLNAFEIDVRAGIVGGGMRRGAVVDALDQRRPATRARALDRIPRGAVHRKHVEPVDSHPGNAVSDRLVGE